MAFNLENLRNDIEALCTRQRMVLNWDPSHQDRNLVQGGYETKLVFSITDTKGKDDDAIIPRTELRHLLLKSLAKKVFDFFGEDAQFQVTVYPGKAGERRKDAPTPTEMAELLHRGGTVHRIAGTHITCIIRAVTPTLGEAAAFRPPARLNSAEKAERFLTLLMVTGKTLDLNVKAHGQADPQNMENPNLIMCTVYAQDGFEEEDTIAPLSARVISFAKHFERLLKLEVGREPGLEVYLGIMKGKSGYSRSHSSPEELAKLIMKRHGSGGAFYFYLPFELHYESA